jgi:hypothetical protein
MTQLAVTSKPFIAVPTSLQEAIQLATMIANSNLAPTDYKGKPEDTFIAIQMGAELGLSPMQSVQNISAINGRPSVWGDAALALAQISKFFGGCREWSEGVFPDDNYTAYCEVIRKGEKPHITKFSIEDAKRAGLWNKAGPWQTYPKRQLQMRARGFGLRDKFASSLKGLYMAEEALDLPLEPRDITPKTESAKGTHGLKARLNISKSIGQEISPAPAEEVRAIPEGEPDGAYEVTVQQVQDEIASAKTKDDLDLAVDLARSLSEEDRKQIRPLYKAKEKELGISSREQQASA